MNKHTGLFISESFINWDYLSNANLSNLLEEARMEAETNLGAKVIEAIADFRDYEINFLGSIIVDKLDVLVRRVGYRAKCFIVLRDAKYAKVGEFVSYNGLPVIPINGQVWITRVYMDRNISNPINYWERLDDGNR